MSVYKHVIPSRCAYATAVVAGDGVGFPFVSLYNGGFSPFVLAVHELLTTVSGGSAIDGFTVQQGAQGSGQILGKSVVSNRRTMAGILSTGLIAALPPYDLGQPGTNSSSGWLHNFPIVVLTPGYSMTAYGFNAATAAQFGFWWQVLTPGEIDDMYGIETDSH
jgi:hypothetical protein